MNFTTEELEHLCFVTRVDLNGTKATLEDTKHCIKVCKKRKEEQWLIDEHTSFRDHLKIDEKFFRPAEVETLLADPKNSEKKLRWKPKIKFKVVF